MKFVDFFVCCFGVAHDFFIFILFFLLKFFFFNTVWSDDLSTKLLTSDVMVVVDRRVVVVVRNGGVGQSRETNASVRCERNGGRHGAARLLGGVVASHFDDARRARGGVGPRGVGAHRLGGVVHRRVVVVRRPQHGDPAPWSAPQLDCHCCCYPTLVVGGRAGGCCDVLASGVDRDDVVRATVVCCFAMTSMSLYDSQNYIMTQWFDFCWNNST